MAEPKLFPCYLREAKLVSLKVKPSQEMFWISLLYCIEVLTWFVWILGRFMISFGKPGLYQSPEHNPSQQSFHSLLIIQINFTPDTGQWPWLTPESLLLSPPASWEMMNVSPGWWWIILLVSLSWSFSLDRLHHKPLTLILLKG